jgi:hypothetical protein
MMNTLVPGGRFRYLLHLPSFLFLIDGLLNTTLELLATSFSLLPHV